ncbi:lipid-A-disaccharide synthase [Vampirovibrio sp.]|uniref:lipid-A-disaccharide synthase n=1 Tax=Vampirovibrio sp. TaxID=2717857 RepID=UPI0035930B85
MRANRLFLLAGDYSGDMHAAKVVNALRALQPDIQLAAVGGNHLKALQVEMLSDQSQMGRVGFGAVLGAWYHYRLGQKILKFLDRFKPDAVLLIDYGGFNLYMAAQLKRRGIRVFYFIPPQVWASRKGRLQKIRANVDHVFCIFPFEKPLYESCGVPVTYVGHPLIGELPPAPQRETFCRELGLDPERPIVALMPGSRKLEIDYLLKAILGSIPLIRHHYPQAQFVLAQAGSLSDDYFLPRFQALWKTVADNSPSKPAGAAPLVLKNRNHALLGVADVMIAASGTVTLEGALYDTPMVLMYKLHPLVYQVVLRLIYLPCMGLPNILTDVNHPIVPELWQTQVQPSAIAQAVLPLLEPGSVQTLRQRNGFAKIRQELNTGGAAQNVAKGILALLHPESQGL